MATTAPQGLDFPDIAPHQVNAVHECDAPAQAVFNVLRDNPGGARWLGWYVTAVRSTSVPDHGAGSTRTVTWLYGIGKLKERFIGWEEGRLWSFTTTSFRPGIISKFVERIRLEPLAGDRCRIVYDCGYETSRLGRPLKRPLAAFVNREIGPTLARLGETAVTQHRAATRLGDR